MHCLNASGNAVSVTVDIGTVMYQSVKRCLSASSSGLNSNG